MYIDLRPRMLQLELKNWIEEQNKIFNIEWYHKQFPYSLFTVWIAILHAVFGTLARIFSDCWISVWRNHGIQ